ncbi:hypothetical protein PF008_g29907, partial [Phytophthora fragariae]
MSESAIFTLVAGHSTAGQAFLNFPASSRISSTQIRVSSASSSPTPLSSGSPPSTMAPNASTQSAHSGDHAANNKDAVAAHFISKFADLQSRF